MLLTSQAVLRRWLKGSQRQNAEFSLETEPQPVSPEAISYWMSCRNIWVARPSLEGTPQGVDGFHGKPEGKNASCLGEVPYFGTYP